MSVPPHGSQPQRSTAISTLSQACSQGGKTSELLSAMTLGTLTLWIHRSSGTSPKTEGEYTYWDWHWGSRFPEPVWLWSLSTEEEIAQFIPQILHCVEQVKNCKTQKGIRHSISHSPYFFQCRKLLPTETLNQVVTPWFQLSQIGPVRLYISRHIGWGFTTSNSCLHTTMPKLRACRVVLQQCRKTAVSCDFHQALLSSPCVWLSRDHSRLNIWEQELSILCLPWHWSVFSLLPF